MKKKIVSIRLSDTDTDHMWEFVLAVLSESNDPEENLENVNLYFAVSKVFGYKRDTGKNLFIYGPTRAVLVSTRFEKFCKRFVDCKKTSLDLRAKFNDWRAKLEKCYKNPEVLAAYLNEQNYSRINIKSSGQEENTHSDEISIKERFQQLKEISHVEELTQNKKLKELKNTSWHLYCDENDLWHENPITLEFQDFDSLGNLKTCLKLEKDFKVLDTNSFAYFQHENRVMYEGHSYYSHPANHLIVSLNCLTDNWKLIQFIFPIYSTIKKAPLIRGFVSTGNITYEMLCISYVILKKIDIPIDWARDKLSPFLKINQNKNLYFEPSNTKLIRYSFPFESKDYSSYQALGPKTIFILNEVDKKVQDYHCSLEAEVNGEFFANIRIPHKNGILQGSGFPNLKKNLLCINLEFSKINSNPYSIRTEIEKDIEDIVDSHRNHHIDKFEKNFITLYLYFPTKEKNTFKIIFGLILTSEQLFFRKSERPIFKIPIIFIDAVASRNIIKEELLPYLDKLEFSLAESELNTLMTELETRIKD